MFDLMKMMGQLKEVKARVQEAQESLKDLRITGEAGAGMVKAIVDGRKRLISIQIDPELNDRLIIQDLIVAAVNNAGERAEAEAREVMRKQTEGLIPNIPGLDLGSMLG